ncbi:uncharacterized protein LOC114175066 [Vigna unguiculata]|uniref:uncharacterized protein LOC114175066 n=1 Tax=Vigna unguiculata TaxID=3917 RepID=UPI001015DACA|nr:uncharacterized protein LOC114175066 [Vigna unguiculata]
MAITTSESNNNNQATLEQIMQHIETLRQKNEIIRKQADGERTQWLAESERRRVEMEVEHERLRKEMAEARQRSDESMRQQEQLHKSNEELRAWMRERSNFRDSNISRRGAEQDENHPLARVIMEEAIPPHFLIPKVSPFTGEGDPEAHLKAFRAQMLISGGSDVVRCKMFVGTFSGSALKWFGKLPNAAIPSFPVFSRLFLERFAVNRPKQLQIADMFDMKQQQEESLKQFLNRFCDVSMGLTNPSKEMLVGAFVKGLRANPFSKSLIRAPATTLAEVRNRATIYIETEEAMQRKRLEERRPPPQEYKGKDIRRQVLETSSPHKRASRKFTPYNPPRPFDKKITKPMCP